MTNLVPTPEIRRLLIKAKRRAVKTNAYDVAAELVPLLNHTGDLTVFVALLLDARPVIKPTQVRTVIDRPGCCLDCGKDLTGKSSWRALCRSCYDHHRHAGDLDEKFPRVTKRRARGAITRREVAE